MVVGMRLKKSLRYGLEETVHQLTEEKLTNKRRVYYRIKHKPGEINNPLGRYITIVDSRQLGSDITEQVTN